MPSATLEDIALRSTDPVKRAIDVFWVIILHLLQMVLLAEEPDTQARRNHPVYGPNTILARFDAGETFDLPPLAIASIRTLVSLVRARLQIRDADTEPFGAPIPTRPRNSAARARLTGKQAAASYRAVADMGRAQRRARRSANPSTAPPPRRSSISQKNHPASPAPTHAHFVAI